MHCSLFLLLSAMVALMQHVSAQKARIQLLCSCSSSQAQVKLGTCQHGRSVVVSSRTNARRGDDGDGGSSRSRVLKHVLLCVRGFVWICVRDCCLHPVCTVCEGKRERERGRERGRDRETRNGRYLLRLLCSALVHVCSMHAGAGEENDSIFPFPSLLLCLSSGTT